MRIIAFFLVAVLVSTTMNSCNNSAKWEANKSKTEDPEYLHRSVKALTDVIVYDIFSPPVASRIYAYPSIAAYESLIHSQSEFQTLAGQLRDLEPLPQPDANKEYSFELASIEAYLVTGQELIFSEEKIAEFREQIKGEFKELGMPEDIFNNSVEYGNAVARHILDWAGKDNYKQTRTFPKYTIQDTQDSWKPTPPDYMEGIEPHWNKIRPFVIDSADQFKPEPPTEFVVDPGSPFYGEIIEVYETVNNLTDEQLEIAQFWDCNPYVSHHQGHVMYATKKITPGGHWIGITCVASRTANKNMIESAEAYALSSVTMADAFISCWDEKWRSVLIRPETVINKYMDEDWVPILQTPPFPEYTSGHSVVSGSASVTLTSLFGDGFAFEDTVEIEYGLPMRKFDSFYDAADEAAISRLYGGIHYMPAITNGVAQGKKIGQLVTDRIKTRKETVAAN